jgi:hypothetical protein
MRNWFRCMLSIMFVLSWSLSPLLVVDVQARDGRDVVKKLKAATLQRKTEDFLLFSFQRDERTVLRKGSLSDETRILDENWKPLSAKALHPGSLWSLKLLYSYKEEGLPTILEMRRINMGSAR